MTSRISELEGKIRRAAPAPHNETPSYRIFSKWFAPVTLFSIMFLIYLLTLLVNFELSTSYDSLVENLPILKNRLDFLQSSDQLSQRGFIVTIVVALMAIPVFVAINVVFYWKLVLSPRQSRKINRYTFFSILMACAVFGLLTWIAFVSVPSSFDPKRPGLVMILFWPFFPALGAGMIYLIITVIFSVLVGCYKFSRRIGAPND